MYLFFCRVQVAALPDAQVRYMTDKIPMKRTGELSEIAELVCFVTSRACSFTTGVHWAPCLVCECVGPLGGTPLLNLGQGLCRVKVSE